MAGRSWLVDKNRFATKIMNASAGSDPRQVVYKSNPTRQCPNCHHVIDNSDEVDDWPGLPPGVKFDPSDPEIIWHLLAKSGLLGLTSHPFIDEFIPTVNQDDGICYTHPKNLPGVKQDGTVSHFFHRAIKAYSTGTRKRRKIHDDDLGDVRWHKTGRTKPVLLDGVQRGCKKIMVLYIGKTVKTNWVMHQYHLGRDEDEKEGDYVVSKIFYQQPQQQTASKQGDKAEQEVSEDIFAAIAIATPKADPVTPKLYTPEPLLHLERLCSGSHVINGCATPHDYETPHEVSFVETSEAMYIEDEVQGIQPNLERPISEDEPEPEPEPGFENRVDEMVDDNEDREKDEDDENEAEENHNWVDSGSQFVLNSQQLVEALSLCDDLLQVSQEDRGGSINNGGAKNKQPCFADYAHLGTEDFKRDLEDCQKLVLEPSNIELDTPPEFRLSQLEFGSQDSFLAWGTGKTD